MRMNGVAACDNLKIKSQNYVLKRYSRIEESKLIVTEKPKMMIENL